MSTLLLLLFAACAAFVQRVSGFGFGIFIMTMLPFLMPSYGEATTLSGLLAMVTSSVVVARMWRLIPWRKLLPILFTFSIVSWFAITVVATQPSELLHKVLGGVLIVASLWFLFFNERVRLSASLGVQVSMGTLAGFMGGLFAMQGPPAVLYFLRCANNKDEYVVLAQSFFLFGNLMMTLSRWSHGLLTPAVGYAWLMAVPGVILGTWVGGIVFKKLSDRAVRRAAYLYMAITGVVTLLC